MNRMRQSRSPAGRKRDAGGYSLVELMAALGVLALALPMIGTAILAGMIENRDSVDSTMTMFVAENALAMVRTRVTHADLMRPIGAGGWGSGKTPLAPIPDVLLKHEDLAWKPFELEEDPNRSVFWCVVVGQRMAPDMNDYRLIAIPYRKFSETATVKKVNVTVNNDDKVTQCEVILELEGGQESTSATIGYLVVRTALRPGTSQNAAIGP